MTSKGRVDFTMLVEVRSHGPGAVVEIKEQDHALADMDEQADLTTAAMNTLAYSFE